MSSMAVSPMGAGSLAPARSRLTSSLTPVRDWWVGHAIFYGLLVLLVSSVVVVLMSVRWHAPIAERVDGHVMVEPGTSVWEVAVATAPPGVSSQRQLQLIEEVNGVRQIGSGGWQVVLLPAAGAH